MAAKQHPPPTASPDPPPFSVLIIGGSVAGLTLSHALTAHSIPHTVLESTPTVAPQIGASIGIMPNGARILDQLGLYSAVEALIEPLHISHITYPDGHVFSSRFPTLLTARFGYPVAFLERKRLLDVLWEGMADQSVVKVGSRVVSVERGADGRRMVVKTKEGETYTADLVVGADGIHSVVRRAMWEALGARMSEVEKRDTLKTQFTCMFGISRPIPSMLPGEQITNMHDGLTVFTFHGKGGRLFWFVVQRLDKTYTYPHNLRYGASDAAASAEKLRHRVVWKGVTFGQIWDQKEVCAMTPLEEGVFETWAGEGMVCIGDSMHKMTPNLGQGANSAIESAAALTNTLVALLSRTPHPSAPDLDTALHAFQTLRVPRAKAISKTAAFVARMQAREGLVNRLIGRYFVPYAGDFPADQASKSIGPAVLLENKKQPERCGGGWEVWGGGRAEWEHGVTLWVLLWVVAVVAVVVLAADGRWGKSWLDGLVPRQMVAVVSS